MSSAQSQLASWAARLDVLVTGGGAARGLKGMLNFPAIFGGTLATKVSAMDLSGGGYFNNPTRNTS